MQNLKNLLVWQKAHLLVKEVYVVSNDFPKEELYGITSQLRRAAVSIPTNIAEGSGRGSDADFKRFLQIAFGSTSEVEYLIFLSKELQFISELQATSIEK
ncbi:MAG: four helix bundle protein [Bacteroidota bacterium]|nr:four helix bundle protein [Bacteroidota bacterium]